MNAQDIDSSFAPMLNIYHGSATIGERLLLSDPQLVPAMAERFIQGRTAPA